MRWLGGHTARVRRVFVLGVLLALAAAGGGWLAFGSGQGGAADSTARAAARPAGTKASLPPLPEMRPKVVQPAAGEVAEATPADDDEVEVKAPKPTRAASGAPKKLDRDAAQVAGDGTHRATALSNGIALPPLEAPEAIHQMIDAGNIIARSPYVWGGGHGKWLDKGYDCSGSVSFVLASAGLLNAPLDSGRLMSWGEPGRGKWVTIYANAGHVWMVVAGIRFDTSGAKVTGSRWQNDMRPTSSFVARHPAGL
jgi:cell wall-associated NlpC family hydrolase